MEPFQRISFVGVYNHNSDSFVQFGHYSLMDFLGNLLSVTQGKADVRVG